MKIKKIFKKTRAVLLGDADMMTKQIADQQLSVFWQQLKDRALNPLNKCGEKYFSQNDEDGITLEILRRIGVDKGVFAEFGVGNGSENNTLILLASGWKGFWVGGEDLIFNHAQAAPRFSFLKRWIDRENVVACLKEGKESLGVSDIDVLSLDLDGNDVYLVEELLRKKANPKLFIVEYNAKFPPPIKWQIAYDKTHAWQGDDYYGASLASFHDVFVQNGYTLVCCNMTGANAFFVRNDFIDKFGDVPRDMRDLFFVPRHYLFQSYGHKPSPKTIERFLDEA